MEDSPVMGLLAGNKTAKSGTEETKSTKSKKAPSETVIKSALRKRVSYIKANSEYAASFCELIFSYCFLLH